MSPETPGPRLPTGFSFSASHCGIKARRRDLGLIVSEAPCTAAGCFTRSRAKAAPVRWCESLLPTAEARAIVVASGNANAMSGPDGAAANGRMAGAIARVLDVPPAAVLTACTGVIGVPFPIERVEQGVEALFGGLAADPTPFAEAILTTDTCTKLASSELFIGGTRVRILGIAKGSGMVHPNMATVLAFLLTDADIAADALATALTDAVGRTFNAVSVDGDTSTNDSAIALANGLADNPAITSIESDSGRAFAAALTAVCRELARAVARDGEGARRLVTVTLEGARDDAAAASLARAVVSSNLVKAALFGADPGYGRILAALGARAAEGHHELDPRRVSVALQGVQTFHRGAPASFDPDALRALLRQRDVDVHVDLGLAAGRAEAWGCDLSYDYVRINADYAAVLVDPDGPVRRDQRLDTKTPELKTELLVSALRYIERFAGTRAVIRYGGSTLSRRDLALSFAEDIHLLSAVGLKPILVQEGASEIVVSALARTGIRAVGLSGADGNLLAWPSAAERSEGHPISVDPDVIETLLQKGYVPVVVPALTEEARIVVGDTTAIDVDQVAAEIARVCKARKLLLLGDSSGLSSEGMLLSELSAEELAERVRARTIEEPMRARARAAVAALESGIDSVHFLDERLPHVIVAELFTDTGVGTMVR
ncbi:MAG: bifunctional glutamate N-acetyltransferase/amino-acid acetyltransferase ArgJ [Polyangiaceae bacterium]|nr:bifunctional glutamate N-acetyltransferase/amino-acid acetyltransferase ArgJ [Polyangiaceae bacterium]